MTLALLHRNPLNVKQFQISPWYGQISKDSKNHCTFIREEFSYRAGCRIFAVKHQKGARTLLDYIGGDTQQPPRWEGWAPQSDTIGSLPTTGANNPHDYTHFVGLGFMSFDFNQHLSIFDADLKVVNHSLLATIFRRMAAYESFVGLQVIPEVVATGIALYNFHVGQGMFSS